MSKTTKNIIVIVLVALVALSAIGAGTGVFKDGWGKIQDWLQQDKEPDITDPIDDNDGADNDMAYLAKGVDLSLKEMDTFVFDDYKATTAVFFNKYKPDAGDNGFATHTIDARIVFDDSIVMSFSFTASTLQVSISDVSSVIPEQIFSSALLPSSSSTHVDSLVGGINNLINNKKLKNVVKIDFIRKKTYDPHVEHIVENPPEYYNALLSFFTFTDKEFTPFTKGIILQNYELLAFDYEDFIAIYEGLGIDDSISIYAVFDKAFIEIECNDWNVIFTFYDLTHGYVHKLNSFYLDDIDSSEEIANEVVLINEFIKNNLIFGEVKDIQLSDGENDTESIYTKEISEEEKNLLTFFSLKKQFKN